MRKYYLLYNFLLKCYLLFATHISIHSIVFIGSLVLKGPTSLYIVNVRVFVCEQIQREMGVNVCGHNSEGDGDGYRVAPSGSGKPKLDAYISLCTQF